MKRNWEQLKSAFVSGESLPVVMYQKNSIPPRTLRNNEPPEVADKTEHLMHL
jgi:hypothetical protein